MRTILRRSKLEAPAAQVWYDSTRPSGINGEFFPWMRMTFPDVDLSLEEAWVPGETLFRSWVLLFGVIPVEYDDIVLEELEPGHRFLERSTMLTQRVWEHERSVTPEGEGCVLTDRASFTPKISWMGGISAFLVRLVFAWRHRRLRRRYGGSPLPSPMDA